MRSFLRETGTYSAFLAVPGVYVAKRDRFHFAAMAIIQQSIYPWGGHDFVGGKR
jgi:hypothetical protein